MKRLIIMQGVPGSGKSYLAERLAEESDHTGKIFSTDNYFMQDGQYTFNPKLLPKAHQWNQEQAVAAMEQGYPLIIIDNTNTQAWEAKEYVKAALDAGYDITFQRSQTEWANDAEVCFEKNTHGVPLPAIKSMLSRLEDLSVEACLNASPPWQKKKGKGK